METTAKLFQNGRSQAVRLPREFRFRGSEVRIRKEGDKVILEPIERTEWPAGYWKQFRPDPGFAVPQPLAAQPVDLDT
jgi:antitoxin VapB